MSVVGTLVADPIAELTLLGTEPPLLDMEARPVGLVVADAMLGEVAVAKPLVVGAIFEEVNPGVVAEGGNFG